MSEDTKINDAVAEELIFHDNITIDKSLEAIYDLTMGVKMKAKLKKDPECAKYENYFQEKTPLLEQKVNEYRESSKSGDINSLFSLCDALCELGNAYRHDAANGFRAKECYWESTSLLLSILEKSPSLLPKLIDALCVSSYGLAFSDAFIFSNKKDAYYEADTVIKLSDFDCKFRAPFKMLNILRSILSDDPNEIDEITYELNSINMLFEYIGEYNYLDQLIIAKAYVKIAEHKLSRGSKSTGIIEGYHRIKSGLIKQIYARDLWKLASPFSESGITDGASCGYNKKEIIDYWFPNEDMAKAYLANIYFTYEESTSVPSPGSYITAWRYASDVLKNQQTEIEEKRELLARYKKMIERIENGSPYLSGPELEAELEKAKKHYSTIGKYFDAIDSITALKNLSAIHAFGTIMCSNLGFERFEIPLESIACSSLREKVFKGTCCFHRAAITSDKKEKADCYKKAYDLLSVLLEPSFNKKVISGYRRYEQVLFAAGYIALAELLGNKKCGIGNDTAKAKEILDGARGLFNKKESREYFEKYYSGIKKSIFGGYSFKWIAR